MDNISRPACIPWVLQSAGAIFSVLHIHPGGHGQCEKGDRIGDDQNAVLDIKAIEQPEKHAQRELQQHDQADI